MLFNSYGFILVFLPLTLFGFYRIGSRGYHREALVWLVAASLFFYGWWNFTYLGLIIASLLGNYAFGLAIGQSGSRRKRRLMLWLGVGINLALLGWFKYANFFIGNINDIFGNTFDTVHVVLPLAISFFTFQQIAYLVDAYHGYTKENDFLRYSLFVTFFPQLIAGPIVHHKEILPQFAESDIFRVDPQRFALGLSIFIVGLGKKVLLADNLSPFVSEAFNASAGGIHLSFFEAWRGALAYTFQLYWDFSGYSDMAVGLGLLFGIRLPVNFLSPYKSSSIIEFWKRWHITLSKFLRDYLYIPLGGNRKGKTRRHINLMTTMLLGGLWHGAGWTFVFWGGLHGIYLVINHGWRAWNAQHGRHPEHAGPIWRGVATVITFAAITFAWVYFRAPDFASAQRIVNGMLGLNGVVWPTAGLPAHSAVATFLQGLGMQFSHLDYFSGGQDLAIIGILLAMTWKLPNVYQVFGHYQPALAVTDRHATGLLAWRPTRVWAVTLGIWGLIALWHLSRVSEFLYFRF